MLHNHNSKENVNFENHCRVKGCLAGETSLIVMDTLEALIKTVHDSGTVSQTIQATLPRALEVLVHLLACNESVTVMEHLFTTLRSIVVKVTQPVAIF